MVNCCKVCGSLIVDGRCSNRKCGTGNRVKWADRPADAFRWALSHGRARLITASKQYRPSDLGGPALGVPSEPEDEEGR